MPIANYLTSGTWLSDQPLRPEAEAKFSSRHTTFVSSSAISQKMTWKIFVSDLAQTRYRCSPYQYKQMLLKTLVAISNRLVTRASQK